MLNIDAVPAETGRETPRTNYPETRSIGTRRVHPILHSTLSSEWIKQLAARNYALDEPIECTFISRGVSDTYRLTTPTGCFALKVYRTTWRTRQAIASEIAVMRHMVLSGVDVAMPVRRKDGDLITEFRAPEGSRRAVLSNWASGRAPKYTDAAQAGQYGEAVARMHAAGETLPADAARSSLDMNYLYTKPMESIRLRLKDFPAVASALAALDQRMLPRLRRAEQQQRNWGFCHGDIWANNARIQDNRLVLFDFEFCGPGWQTFDLASYRWHARHVGHEQVAWKPFIEGYRRVRPFSDESLDLVGLFMILKHLWTTAHWIGRLPETGLNFLPDDAIENIVTVCEQIEADLVES